MEKLNVKKAVFEALDNALENEYDFRTGNPMDIGDDLVAYDSSLENYDAEELMEHIVAWQKSKKS